MAYYRRSRVRIQGKPAGILCETEDGYQFSYLPEYLEDEAAVAVSLTMPLSENAYESKVLMPFFDGLIPEGWLLDVVVRNWKINYNDRFGLLLASCMDCIGDVSIEEVQNEDR